MSTFARAERAALASLLLEVGPDAPTLCEGWTAADLAAHLVVRERRPDSALGVVFRPAAGWADRIRDAEKRRGYELVVQRFAAGPPRWSLFAFPRVDEGANGVEFFIHHEDVRRARPGWQPRQLTPEQVERLWRRLRAGARLAFRSVPAGVVLARPDGRRVTARSGAPAVTITGEPAELTLYASGRKEHAQVTLTGDADAREALARTRLGI